jgi:phosphatidylserine/phosphatidylglycerophosphate/cardiolipin synthase-like enzyme
MITVTGRIVDELNAPVTGVQVVALGDWLLTRERLIEPIPVGDPGGKFKLEVESVDPVESIDVGTIIPTFRVRVIDRVGRQLSEDRLVPGTAPSHDLQDIRVNRADARGLVVTNRTGTPRFVSEGNAVKLLVDGEEAFGRVVDEMKLARHSIDMAQLFFSVPDKFSEAIDALDPETKEPNKKPIEKPELIFKFSAPELQAIDPLDKPTQQSVPRIHDERPERLLMLKAKDDKTLVRILMNEPGFGFPEGFFWLAVFTPLVAMAGVGVLAGMGAWVGIGIPFFPLVLIVTVVAFFIEFVKIKLVLEETTDVDKLNRYFSAALSGEAIKRIIVRGFRQKAPDHGVQHCKMMIVDNDRAVVVGSPFSQRYFDSVVHPIENPKRGSNTSDMVHDLSIAVVGPAARHLSESFRLYWNEDIPKSAELEDLPGDLEPNTQTSGEDAICKVQVVRTLSGPRFEKGLGGRGEKGILEGYLRAFAAAKHYIYLETQYFTDGVITDALVAALKANADLELILVVPIKPDVLFYTLRQACRINRLREAGGNRVGVFTRWTYDGERPNNARPWVAPVYIHAKGAVVDDSWATVGSANLDGLSLDYNVLLSPLVFGETTACELNLNLLPATEGTVNPFAQLMRRRLFAEHLGLPTDDERLANGPEFKWLDLLWRPEAKGALTHVQDGRRAKLPGFVLEYPQEDGGWLDTPRKHLAALGVELAYDKAVVRPMTGTRKFHFSTGKWDVRPTIEDVRL